MVARSETFCQPLATHGFAAGFATFEASFQVGRPADIGSAIILVSAFQHVNEEEYRVLSSQRGFRSGVLAPSTP